MDTFRQSGEIAALLAGLCGLAAALLYALI
jgi:hypothetical protein